MKVFRELSLVVKVFLVAFNRESLWLSVAVRVFKRESLSKRHLSWLAQGCERLELALVVKDFSFVKVFSCEGL